MYIQSPGFGALTSLQAVTQAKFGQPGLDAINNYPHLVRAQIDETLYMKEEGKARPAKSFSLHKLSDNSVAATGISGRADVLGSGCAAAYDTQTGLPCETMFQAAGASAPPVAYAPPPPPTVNRGKLLVGALVALAAIAGVVVMMRNRG